MAKVEMLDGVELPKLQVGTVLRGDWMNRDVPNTALGMIMQDTGSVVLLDTGNVTYIYPNDHNKKLRLATEIQTKKFLRELRDIPINVLNLPTSIHVGADPEVFVVDKSGECIPAWKFLPKKKNAIPHTHGTTFYDGFQAEYTITSTYCHGYMIDFVRSGLRSVLEAARKVDKNAKLTPLPVVTLSPKVRHNTPKEHLALGCSPSKNAYGEDQLAVPSPEDLEWRFAGSHFHFKTSHKYNPTSKDGYTTETPTQITNMVKMMDAIAGVANVAIAGNLNQPERRRFYGRAGEYRIPDVHRLEWRVPDTLIMSHPGVYMLMRELSRVALRMGIQGLNFLWKTPEDEIRHAINTSDTKLARKILSDNEPILKRVIEKAYCGWNDCGMGEWMESTMKILHGGMESVLEDPMDMERNWFLTNSDIAVGHTGGVYKNVTWSGCCVDIAKGKKV